MIFNDHSKLKGMHAFLSASNYHWLNYTPDKLLTVYDNMQGIALGTELHEFAAKCIELHQNLPKSKKTLNMYVNDAIRYGMRPEQVLFYSNNCFGTADAILFENDILRIHDLKTGSSKVSMNQLMIYAALFCLEYGVIPSKIEIELRIYQNNEVQYYEPEPEEIEDIIDKIIEFDKILSEHSREREGR